MKLIDIFQKLDESSVNEVHSHDEDYEDCDMCSGTGEGRWEGETCSACHGSGVQEPEHDDDDFDIPDDDFDAGDEESYYEKSIRSRGLEEELAMKHQRDHQTQKYADTSNSLAKRSFSQAEVPNVTKSADGHPTVKYRGDSTHKAGQTRVEPTITPTTVKKKESDRPIPSFLQKEVEEGNQNKPERPEADYGDDYQAMVSRVKKLAGLGPLKTVWDPEKRVYKNVPVAVQPKK